MNPPFFLANPIFAQAVAEIESIGFRVSEKPDPGSTPYMVIAGRSNQRWWLIPLTNRNVSLSGLAMFQPVVTSAKLLKAAGIVANLLGLPSLLTHKKIYISGKSSLADIFSDNDLHYAFFSGTDSPHRKLAVQVMDANGSIKGFAKVTRNPAVQPLLAHEAVTLNHLRTLDLKTAHIPTVLFSGEQGGASILVTDTLKTSRTTSSTTLNKAHLAFLTEMASKTAASAPDDNDNLVSALRRRYEAVSERLPSAWQHRIEECINYIGQYRHALGHSVLSHGDFTPWNTFFVDGQLYVFDWEYAGNIYPAGYDLVHFMLSRPQTNRQPAVATVEQVLKTLGEAQYAGSNNTAKSIFMTYLCGHTLHYIGRVPVGSDNVNTWDGAEKIAALLDTLMARKN